MMNREKYSIGERLSYYTKNDAVGFHSENNIFDVEESIMVRFSRLEELVLNENEIRHYYIFSKQQPAQIYCLTVRNGDTLKDDKRPYKHFELHEVVFWAAPEYNSTVPFVLREACKNSNVIITSEEALVEAMGYIAQYIPTVLREKLIFTIDDSVTPNVVFVKKGVPKKINDAFVNYSKNPKLYYEGFEKIVNKYYSLGRFGDGIYKRFIDYMTEVFCEDENIDIDNQTEPVHSKDIEFLVRPYFYPINIDWISNSLLATAILNNGCQYKSMRINTQMWQQASCEDIMMLLNTICSYNIDSLERQCFLSWIEPNYNIKRRCLFDSLYNYLSEESTDVGMALSLISFFADDLYNENDFVDNGLEPKSELHRFYRIEHLSRYEKKMLLKKMRKSGVGIIKRWQYSMYISFGKGKRKP